MDTEQYRQQLTARERELVDSIATFEDAGRNARTAEVEDPIDRVTSDEARAASFDMVERERTQLLQVRDALQRIQDGSYGKCIVCGKQIEEARLRAVPWTPYCHEDQEAIGDVVPEPETLA